MNLIKIRCMYIWEYHNKTPLYNMR
jgi:hypothetical protein